MAPERRDPLEHALLIVKPGPLQRQTCDALPGRLAAAGLSIVGEAERRLGADDVRASFKYTGPEYVELWTRDTTIAVLVAGRDALARALDVRDVIRREHGRRRSDIYNLLHLSDVGWEFVRQFAVFFPGRAIEPYAGFGDLLLQPPLAIGDLLARSSVGAIGLVEGTADALEKARASGVHAIHVQPWDGEGLKWLGIFADRPVDRPGVRSTAAFFDWVHDRRGLVFLDVNDDRLPPAPVPRDASESKALTPAAIACHRTQIDPFRQWGLDGIVVLHPRRHAFVLETLWEIVEADGLLQLGGSAGAAPPLTFAMRRRATLDVLAALGLS